MKLQHFFNLFTQYFNLRHRLVTLSSCHLVTLSPYLFIFLLVACSGASDAPVNRTANTDETAIEQFLTSAPKSAGKAMAVATVASQAETGLILPEVNPLLVFGDLYLAGSANMSSLNRQMYERFVTDGYSGSFKIEDIGTGAGFQALCHEDPAQPLADIVAASRPILQAELDACLQIGRVPLALWVAMDALVVVVHPDNNLVKDVTLEDLSQLIRVRRWSDVNPAWPQDKILRILPNKSSNNFNFLAGLLFAGNERLLETLPNTIFLQDEVEMITQLQDSVNAISVITYESYLKNSDGLRMVLINGMQPDTTTIQQDKWPFSRPLLFYTTVELLQEKPQLSSFLTYYLTHVNEEVVSTGKFPLKRAALDRSKLSLLTGINNTAWLEDLRDGGAGAESK